MTLGVTYPYTFEYSKYIESFFEENNIFLRHHNVIKGVFQFGEKITLTCPIFVEPNATFSAKSFMNMSAFSFSSSKLTQKVKIGRYCSVSWQCEILGMEHPTERISTHLFTFREYWNRAAAQQFGKAPRSRPFQGELPPPVIGNDVWIGQGVKIKGGITIGDGAVIAAGAVVTKDVSDFEIVGGVPAKRIRFRFDETLQSRIKRIAWWLYHVADFHDLNSADPNEFLDGLERKIGEGLKPYSPQLIDLAVEINSIVTQN